ncbi:MAG TPA: hypothetical protein VLW84_04810 [Terriglobales bacterium]|nr:hypothetical protein [Terriglobales bacterium]
MRMMKLCSILAIALFAGVALLPRAQASLWNQMTVAHFSQPIALPGMVLPAGTYRFVLLDSNSNRNVVQIFSDDWSTIYATFDTIPDLRSHVSGRSEFDFAERPHDRPEALMVWFFPGLTTGHEFVYPARQERRLDHDAKNDVLASPLAQG